MNDQQATNDSDPYEYLRLVLQRFPKARVPTREEFDAVSLGVGKGHTEGEYCSVQRTRFWEGLDASSDDVPETDSEVCGKFLICFQNAVKDTPLRVRLCRPLAVKLIGSAGSPELEQRRAWMAADWALREVAPAYFDMSPELEIHAKALRALPPITCRADATAAFTVRDAARSAAWELRKAKLDEFREKFAAELAKHPDLKGKPAAVAAAVVVVAEGSDRYWAIRNAVYSAVYKQFRESTSETVEKLRAIQRASWESGALCLSRMLDLKEQS